MKKLKPIILGMLILVALMCVTPRVLTVNAATASSVSTSVSKVVAKAKGFKVSWKKKSGVKGYQIQYSTSSKFTKSTTKTKTVKGRDKTSATISELKGCNATYYVRIRTYKIVNGKTVYSSWSSVKKITTLKHSYAAATCTKAKTCKYCGKTTGDKLGHKWKAATCTKAKTCTRCNKTTGSKLGHKWKAATCTKAKTCTRCSKTTGSKLGHKWKAATCTKAKTCTRCNKTTGSKLGHTYKSKITKATCASGGYTTHKCSACGDSYIDNRTFALEHTHNEKGGIAATCTEDGYIKYVCACGDSYIDPIAKKGHNYKATVTKPTCTKGGYTTNKCSTCGHSYVSNETKAAGHSYKKIVTDATCTTGGYTTHKCSTCGKSYVDNKTSALGHSYAKSGSKAATCTEAGYAKYVCSCGDSYTKKIKATGHSYKSTVTKAYCTTDGYTTHKCSTCGHSYVDNKVSALGHSYKDTVIKATCLTGGFTTHTCTRCNYTYTDSRVDALGHNYVVTSDTATCASDGTITETCKNCQRQRTSSSDALPHTPKIETVMPTCGKSGHTTETCTVCGIRVSYTTIPATGEHKYETKVMSDVAKSDSRYLGYAGHTDWLVERCSSCGFCQVDKMRFRYTAREAAEIMLKYVNDLRAEVYGTHDYDLVLDDKLLELSEIRALEISKVFEHGGTYTNAGENITHGGYSIYAQFCAWKKSEGHYQNMIDKDYKYFGYALYNSSQDTRYIILYGVQLFWGRSDKNAYYN